MIRFSRMNQRACTSAVAVIAVLAFSAPRANAILIDNFNVGTGSLTNSNVTDGTVTAGPGSTDTDLETGFATTNVIGGARQMDIPGQIPVSGTGTLTMRANASDSGLLSFSLDAGTSGSAIVTWNANGAGLTADFTDAGLSDFFTFDVVSIDQGLVDLIVTVSDSSNSDTFVFSNAGVGNVQFPFSAFSGVDFTMINQVSLEVQGQDASDLTLDQFFTSGDMSIPEPATMSLLGLSGLFLLRRRRVNA